MPGERAARLVFVAVSPHESSEAYSGTATLADRARLDHPLDAKPAEWLNKPLTADRVQVVQADDAGVGNGIDVRVEDHRCRDATDTG
jgi:hypothetical protein